MSGKPALIPLDIETRVVALLARGDTHASIARTHNINIASVRAIKKRNQENLAIIEQQLLTRATEDALSIKQEANSKLSKRLKRDDKAAEVLDKAYDQYLNEEITIKEYSEIVRRVKEMSVGELVSISKEMHNQSTETEKPATPQADLSALAAAIASGDEVKITQAVFNARS